MTFDHPEITVVVHTALNSNCEDIRNNLYDFTQFKLGGRYNLNIVATDRITQTLSELTSRWAVIVAIGNYIEGQGVIIDTVRWAEEQQAPLVAHLLDQGGYYHFHPQYFCVDLHQWRVLGSPAFEETNNPTVIKTRLTERSIENAHGDYTPLWLTGKDTITEYSSDRTYFGINVVAEFINNGQRVVNIPESVRYKKNYCYPGHNHDEIVQLIANPHYEPKDEALWWFAQTLRDLTANLDRGYYVLNTETATKYNPTPMDCFAGVCGGLKPAVIAGADNFIKGSSVVLFDISTAALAWQEHLINTWDGDFANFNQVFEQFKTQHSDFVPIYHVHNTLDQNIDWFLSSAGIDRIEFQRRWQKYLTHKFLFLQLDLLKEEDVTTLAKNLCANQGCYVWISNVFVMEYLMFFKTRAGVDRYTQQFVEILQQHTPATTVLENCGSVRILSNV